MDVTEKVDRRPRVTPWFGSGAAVLLALLVLWAQSTRASERASTTVAVYSDDDSVTVVSPTARGTVTVGPVDLSATAGVDVVSAASVDIVSAASPRGFQEVRAHGQLEGLWAPTAGTELGLGYTLSTEPDFLTHGLSLSATRDFFNRLSTAGLSYAFSWSRVGVAGDPSFAAYRRTHQAEASWSQVLTATATIDLAYGLTWVNGYQANPYRFVRLFVPGAELHGTAVSEHAPDFRARHSGTLRARARLAPDVFSVAEYSLYADSWGMLAHTGRIRASFSFGGGSQWTTVAEVRGHTQTGVVFYRRRYDTLPEAPVLRTGEKELGPLWSALGSLHLDWTPNVEWAERFRVGLGADVLHLRYLDHPVLQQRTAVIGMLDVSWEN